jgi:hypothetical protein
MPFALFLSVYNARSALYGFVVAGCERAFVFSSLLLSLDLPLLSLDLLLFVSDIVAIRSPLGRLLRSPLPNLSQLSSLSAAPESLDIVRWGVCALDPPAPDDTEDILDEADCEG